MLGFVSDGRKGINEDAHVFLNIVAVEVQQLWAVMGCCSSWAIAGLSGAGIVNSKLLFLYF